MPTTQPWHVPNSGLTTHLSKASARTEFREMGLLQGTRGRYRLRLEGLAALAVDA